MDVFLAAVVRGLGNGSTYALLALGFVIIYKSTSVISFAQPALMLAGATAIIVLQDAVALPFAASLVLAMLVTAALGLGIERSALRPMVGRPVFVAAIITIGVDIAIRVVLARILGLNLRSVRNPWGLDTFQVGGVFVQVRFVVMIIALAIVMALLVAFFRYSRVGLAMRATAFDQETALAQGVNVGRVFALSWAIAGALAALAGMFVGTGASIDPQTWIIALKALPAIIIGGLDSVGGAVVGGLAVGLVESLVGAYQPAYFPWLGANFAIVSPYALLLLVLLVRPYGLFGTPEVERV